ncbi:MAG TPA: PQQ-dependent sugar dehydrogenase [Planctomycetota bacterium]
MLRPLLAVISFCISQAFVGAQAPPPGFTYQTVTDNALSQASSMAFAPDGRLFVCERSTGNIRIVWDGALLPGNWATVPCANNPSSEHGLLGIAIDPEFLLNGFVYVYYTTADQMQNRIARIQDTGAVGVGFTILSPANAIPTGAATKHSGGRMVFGRDGTLFIGTGDRFVSSTAPSLTTWNGKVLRFEVPNLTIPANNPFPGSPIFSYGHRNQFGITVRPATGDVYQAELGDLLADEINRIVAGGNYGWPTYEGLEPIPNPNTVDPIAVYSAPTPDPAGCCFYSGTIYPASYHGSLFWVEFTEGKVRKVDLDAAGTTVLSQSIFDDLVHAFDIQMGPDGNLWVLHTDNVGARGADEIGRYVFTAEPNPGIQVMAVSNRVIGGAMTIGMRANVGDLVFCWVSLGSFPSPVPTPFGPLWVPLDLLVSANLIWADGRAYFPFSLPNHPIFTGIELFTQGARFDPVGALASTANFDSIVMW